MENKNIFVYGMSGSGKDTVANYLRDNYGYAKLRCAGTIKQYVFETYGFNTQEEFENAKRMKPEIRLAHNIFGNLYDKESKNLSNELGSLNRLRNIINRVSLEFEMTSEMKTANICICDCRCIEEVEMLLDAGWYGVFLHRKTNEFKDTQHRTEQSIIDNGKLDEIISENQKYEKQIFHIMNDTEEFNNTSYLFLEVDNIINVLSFNNTKK